MQKEEKIKVLYFAGSGRSGSTILNIILGNHQDVFGGGELQNMRRVYNKDKICSCGATVVDCDFWSSVVKDWYSKVGEQDIDSGLKRWPENEGVFSFKPWMKMIFSFGLKGKNFQKYLESTAIFYKAIQKHSNKKVMVDISKNPLRAWALEKNPNVDLRMVHLVRDGRAVTWSLKRTAERQSRKRPTWRAALFWVVVNRMTNFVRSKVVHNTVVRYEDLVERPAELLHQIGSMADIDFSEIIEKIEAQDDFHINHVMAGNGIRKGNTIKFQATNSKSWMEKLTPGNKRLFKFLSYSSLRKFNYL